MLKQNGSLVRNVVLILAGVYFIGTVVFIVRNYNRADDVDRKQAALESDLKMKLTSTEAETRASVNMLAARVVMTDKELNKRAAAQNQEELALKGQAAAIQRRERELESRLARLEHSVGDLNSRKEPVATNHDELDILKQRGDRNYYEFALVKGDEPTEVANVGLQLEKVDPREKRFSLSMLADYKKIEKTDRTVNMPLQVFAGADRNLYEVVVNRVDRDRVTGYLSTPKNSDLRQPIPVPAIYTDPQSIHNPGKISLRVPEHLAARGASFGVSVYLEGGRDVYSVPMRISYDPRLFRLKTLSYGDFFAQDGQAAILTHRDDSDSGILQINVQRPPGASGVSGRGTVVYITFVATETGEGHVSVLSAGLHGQTTITVN